MYYKYDRSEADAYANFLLHKKFTPKNAINGILNFQEILNYVVSLAKSVKSWFYIFNIQYSNYNDDIKEWVQKLNRLALGAFPPLLMVAFNKEVDEQNLIKLLKAAERFQFLIFRVSQRQSNTKNSHLYRLANMYHTNQDYWGHGLTDIGKIIGDIRWNTDGWSGDEYVGYFDLSRFRNYIIEQDKKEEGYYSWNGLRYFLYEYELHLQKKANNNQKISWFDFNKRKKEDTIEHIYPQTATDQCWKDSFKEANKKQRKSLLHSLGNLVLLAKSKNSSLQNRCFDYKKRHKNDSNEESYGFYNGSYSEIQVASYVEWTPKEILDRGLKMLKFMEDRWEFNIDDWEMSREDLLTIKIETANE